MGSPDARSDDLLVVRQVTQEADVVLVVRVFPGEANAPAVAVVSFFAPDGTTLSAFTGTKGVPIEAKPEESVSSVGVSREARQSISSVLKDPKEASGDPAPGRRREQPGPAATDDLRRFEVTLAPVGVAIPLGSIGDFGSLARVGVQFTPLLGAYVTGFVRWLRTEPGVVSLTQDQALSVDGHFGAGVALVPVRSKMFLLGLRAGVGLAATSLQVRPTVVSMTGATLGSSFLSNGVRPVGSLSLEVAFVISPTVRVGLEVRNSLMSSATTAINGCSEADLRSMDVALRSGRPVVTAQVGSGCQVASFDGTDPSGVRRSNDVPLALFQLRQPAALAYRLAADLSVTISF